jgi:hypothetical protein
LEIRNKTETTEQKQNNNTTNLLLGEGIEGREWYDPICSGIPRQRMPYCHCWQELHATHSLLLNSRVIGRVFK